jgi:hypothetical protein
VYSEISPDELINNIKINENLIQNVRAHFSVVLVEKNGYLEDVMDWGYEGGKEYLRGTENFLPNEMYEIENCTNLKMHTKETVKTETAFDGSKCYFYRKSSNEQNPIRSRGAVSPLNPSVFCYKLTPNILMGYDVKEFGRSSLAETIKQAESFSIKRDMETINDRSCYVIEINSAEIDPGSKIPWDAKVWIDPERGFRPQRIEKYFGGVKGNNKYKVLRQRTDILEMKQVDGIWFPIKGLRSWFKISDVTPPEGMSVEDFGKLPEEERRCLGKYDIKKEPLTRMVTVDYDTIRINKGIDEKEFKVTFPVGCAVFDEFIQSGYVVGGKDSITTPQNNPEIDLNKPDISDPSGKSSALSHDTVTATQQQNPVPSKKEVLTDSENKLWMFDVKFMFIFLTLLVLTSMVIVFLLKHKRRSD